jgi:hypothetical protein
MNFHRTSVGAVPIFEKDAPDDAATIAHNARRQLEWLARQLLGDRPPSPRETARELATIAMALEDLANELELAR